MSSDESFVCAACGREHGRRRVEYDPLGYPVCPVCGTVNR